MPPTSSAMRIAPAPMPVMHAADHARPLPRSSGPSSSPRTNWRTSGSGASAIVGRRAAVEDPAAVEERDLVDELRERHDVGRYREHGRAGPRLVGGEQVVDLLRRDRIEAGGRLVVDHDLGVGDGRARDADALLHAARQLAGELVLAAGEADRAQPRLRRARRSRRRRCRRAARAGTRRCLRRRGSRTARSSGTACRCAGAARRAATSRLPTTLSPSTSIVAAVGLLEPAHELADDALARRGGADQAELARRARRRATRRRARRAGRSACARRAAGSLLRTSSSAAGCRCRRCTSSRARASSSSAIARHAPARIVALARASPRARRARRRAGSTPGSPSAAGETRPPRPAGRARSSRRILPSSELRVVEPDREVAAGAERDLARREQRAQPLDRALADRRARATGPRAVPARVVAQPALRVVGRESDRRARARPARFASSCSVEVGERPHEVVGDLRSRRAG